MKVDTPLPSFEGATAWLNRKSTNGPQTLAREIKGRPTLVHFWALASNASLTNLAHIAELRDQRRHEGLRVIAVHLPGSAAEMDPRAVKDATERLNLTEPCALDNDRRVSLAFANKESVVPAYYLFDTDGRLRGSASGESGLFKLEDQLDELLRELRSNRPFCPECEFFLNDEALFCANCGLPLVLPNAQGAHPYYESHHSASLPTVRLVNPDPMIGRIIDGRYELTARLGEGAMSVVYRARRVHIGDDVAVKVLLRKLMSDETALARFRREARAAALVHHQNVITIHDFGETGDGDTPPFIVMEFVKGTPLRDLLNSEVQFSVERALRLMRGICAGVGAAHRQGVVHRDLKPENILVVAPDHVDDFESVRVVDFGLAKVSADAAVSPLGAVVGTPYYMSPEQCLGEPLDSRSDVYSLGAMFYELLSGKWPFKAETVSGVISQHLSEPPPPLPANLGIPRRISTGIMRALAKDPDDRPQTAAELARQL